MQLRLFPLGTSRLHWPLEYVTRGQGAQVYYPGFGYFQSAGQVADIAEWLGGTQLRAPARWVFRKDGTPSNPFDNAAYEGADAFVTRRRRAFVEADVILLEISSAIEFVLGDASVQGNPNVEREVPFSEVWKTGYYTRFAPDLPVRRVDIEDRDLGAHMDRIAAAVDGRPVIAMSHIYTSQGKGFGRRAFAERVEAHAVRLGWEWLDPTPLADAHGFRPVGDGSIDIHHLSWPGMAAMAAELLSRASDAADAKLADVTLAAVRNDRWIGMSA